MTDSDKRYFIWEKAYQDALGCSHPYPDAYADKRVIEIMGRPFRKDSGYRPGCMGRQAYVGKG